MQIRWTILAAGALLLTGQAAALPLPIWTGAAAVWTAQQAAARTEQVIQITSREALQIQLRQAIQALGQPPPMDVRALPADEDRSLLARNLYYQILAEQPELKYAYDMQAVLDAQGILHCTISYMPYRSGRYPAGFSGVPVSDLSGLCRAAQAGLEGQTPQKIRILDPQLQVDAMNRALQQVGGSYVLCQLNRDATAITFTPAPGFSYADALARLDEIDRLAAEIVRTQTTPDMTARERAQALYTYLTEHVRYDHRYYSDRTQMPYDSQTAYGALHDGLAICGGYAQALQTLFLQADIPCCTVSGRMRQEYHMWNAAYLDGAWRYFDPTSDRGRAAYGFLCFAVPPEQLEGYTWDAAGLDVLLRSIQKTPIEQKL